MLGVIQAGGQNRRFGSDKAFIQWGEAYLIQRTIEILKSVLEEVVIITNDHSVRYRELGCTLLKDMIPGKGCLGGLYTGINHSRDGKIFTVACDMPFLDRAFIEYMVNLEDRDNYEVIIPRTEVLQPMHAMYSDGCIPHIEALMRQGNLKILDFFDSVKLKEISPEVIARFDPQGLIFYNINTPENLEQAKKLRPGSEPTLPS